MRLALRDLGFISFCVILGVARDASAQLFPARRDSLHVFLAGGVVANLNSDPWPDVVVGDATNGRVIVLRGIGDGGFQHAFSFPAGATPQTLAAADFDHDGKIDVVTANDSNATISLLRGNGNASFLAPVQFNSGGNARGVVAADLDGDGNDDVAVANYGYSIVSVLHGNGSGAFSTPVSSLAGGHSPTMLVVDDFDLDGRLDLAVADGFAVNVSLLLGQAGGSFAAPKLAVVGPDLEKIASGDFDGDGKPDLFATKGSFAAGSLAFLKGNGASGFSAPVAMAGQSGSFALCAADFDADGRLDVACASVTTAMVRVFHGDGIGGIISTEDRALPKQPVALFASDLDADGKRDLVAIGNDSSTGGSTPLECVGTLLHGHGATTSFEAPSMHSLSSAVQGLALGDLDGDGNLDAVVAEYAAFTIGRILGDGQGGFGAEATFGVDKFPNAVALGDVDLDGFLDAVTSNNGVAANDLSWLRGLGNGAFAAAVNFPAGKGPGGVTLVDVDQDGRVDALFVDNGGAGNVPGRIGFAKGGTLGFGVASFSITASFTQSLATGDLDGDGHVDAVVADPGNKQFVTMFGNGNGGFTVGAHHGWNAEVWSPAIDDLDGDGIMDVVAAVVATPFASGDGVLVYRGIGGGVLQNPIVALPTDLTPETVRIADVDGDGFKDIVTGNFVSSSASVLLGDGAFGFATSEDYLASPLGAGLELADLDGDGRLDLVTAGQDNFVGSLAVSKNLGGCGFAQSYGAGCPGQGGFTPALSINGCAKNGATLTIDVTGGSGGAAGLFVFGSGQGAASITPNCTLLVAPLLPFMIPFVTTGSGAGAGSVHLVATIPEAFPAPILITMQALLTDPVTFVAATPGAVVKIS